MNLVGGEDVGAGGGSGDDDFVADFEFAGLHEKFGDTEAREVFGGFGGVDFGAGG